MFTNYRLLRHPYAWIALGFGSGLSPKAPGTLGSLVAVVLWWFLYSHLPLSFQLAIIVACFFVGFMVID